MYAGMLMLVAEADKADMSSVVIAALVGAVGTFLVMLGTQIFQSWAARRSWWRDANRIVIEKLEAAVEQFTSEVSRHLFAMAPKKGS